MKTDQPTAAQRRWREAVREIGCDICGAPAQVHHAVGRTAKHDRVEIGHWWIIALCDGDHRALHAGETFGFESRKAFEKARFLAAYRMLSRIVPAPHMRGPSLPPAEVLDAIASYHK